MNDNEGFAIYAAGYTGNEVGGTNSNKLVGTTASGNATIESGIATGPVGSNDISNWAMKLTMTQDSGDTTTDNAFTINSAPNVALPSTAESGATQAPFSSYHVVPNEYTKVAHKNSMTDMTETTGGVKLTTTYAAYISKTQPADTYSGQVKYTLVHPSYRAAPQRDIEVTYNSGELRFQGNVVTNSVRYMEDCSNTTLIVTNPLISKTDNINDDGSQNGSYSVPTEETALTPVTAIGASKMKVIIRHGLSGGTMIAMIEGNWNGGDEPEKYKILEGPTTGSSTYVFDGDTVTFYMRVEDVPNTSDGQDYGYYAEIYPIYDTKPVNTEVTAMCGYTAADGVYQEPNHFKGIWKIGSETFTDEEEIKTYISSHVDEIASTGLTITAANPYAIVYDGNTASAGTMSGFVTIPYPEDDPNETLDFINSPVDLLAPNFKKTGYGFAGWSENPNATVNGSDVIYGPNQSINAGDLAYDEDNNKSAVLYAVWVDPKDSMQNFSCETLDYDEVVALIDIRDRNAYTVSKLADGNCWMMENLRLDNTATISSTNTDNPATGFTSIAASSDDWCTDDNETCINQNKLNTNNTNNINLNGTNASNTPLINGPGQYNGSNTNGGTKGSDGNNYSWYSYGNYYNWYTATAGTGTYSQTSGDTTGSICPSGWVLPSGYQSSSNKGQFSTLDSAMGGTGSDQSSAVVSNRWRSYPANFLYSGGWRGFGAGARGLEGLYWSRTAVTSGIARTLYFAAEGVYPVTVSDDKWNGLSVRCLSLGS